LRLKILAATATGDIERLRTPVEWNEVPPLFERGLKKGPGFDPLDALKALQAAGCVGFFFKYCSTFDSTDQGNIGPVGDALLDALDAKQDIPLEK
jgi:hypothetical protein